MRSTTATILLVGVLSATLLAACGGSPNRPSSSAPQGSFCQRASVPSGTAPGTVVRSVPLAAPEDSRGWRVCYVTTTADGRPALSTGMVFAPKGSAPPGGRFVVSWAHPTTGLSDKCAPSARKQPSKSVVGLTKMLQRGWVVVASDYTGLGTPGTSPYLVGRGEAANVIDAVRAARTMPDVHAGTDYAVFGWSQGAQASLFTPSVAQTYAPELHLVGVAGDAPPTLLDMFLHLQWNNRILSWQVGSEIAATWPELMSGLERSRILTPQGLRGYSEVAQLCTPNVGHTLKVLVPELTSPFFKVDPSTVTSWSAAAVANTPPSAPKVPVFVAQGEKDKLVPPSLTASLQHAWCAESAPLEVDWLAHADHASVASRSEPQVIAWLAGRAAGSPPPSNCPRSASSP